MKKNATVITIADTKGGSTKSTTAVNIAAFIAHAGLKTLLLDFDLEQPTACSYFPLQKEAPFGVYEFLIMHETDLDKLISATTTQNLDVMSSNSVRQEIVSHLNSSADGIIRLKSCLKLLKNEYDVIVIDTVGTIDPTVNMAVLASDVVLSPLDPSMPGVREYLRGTIHNLFRSLIPFTDYGIKLPPVYTFFNRVEENNDCRRIKELFNQQIKSLPPLPFQITVLDKDIKKKTCYKVAASLGIAAFQYYTEPTNKVLHPYKITKAQAQSVKDDIYYLCQHILPRYQSQFDAFMKAEITH